MKISQMLKRENFYDINYKTLTRYFKDEGKETSLYIYPQLNAIITKSPSNEVKNYLFCEYKIRGNVLKAMLVKAYVACCFLMNGKMATEKIVLKNNMTDDMLIYPCNKKYRIFNFKDGVVDVIAKSDFPTGDLDREILFRTENKAEFIPELIAACDKGYRERIIDGIPLARMTEQFDIYRELALTTLRNYAKLIGKERKCLMADYLNQLLKKIEEFSCNLTKNYDRELLTSITASLMKTADETFEIQLTLSHGDLQPGNIWVEHTGKMFIIDWESWDERSVWYDEFALYHNLRNGTISACMEIMKDKNQKAVVCIEDLLFHLNELYNLPYDYGEQAFSEYLNDMYQGINKGA